MRKNLALALLWLAFMALTGLPLPAEEIARDVWIAEGVSLTKNPPKIIVAPFTLETAAEQIDKNSRELYEFRNSLVFELQNEIAKQLVEIAPAKAQWLERIPSEGWLVSGEFLYAGDSALAPSQGREFLKGISSTMKIKRIRTQVYLFDLSKSKEKYVMSFQTGWDGNKQERAYNPRETAKEILRTFLHYLRS